MNDTDGSNDVSAADARRDLDKNDQPSPNLIVVGIGASAGGLEALRRFLEAMPSDTGMAFVVVVHLSPEHESYLAGLLQSHTTMTVQQIGDIEKVEPNNVYIIPPNRNLSAIDTHLRLSPLEEQRSARAPIDHFFRTLSETHDGESIGIILSGTGSDGTVGIQHIKERGGLTVAQEPSDAAYDGMPQSSISTGMVDLVLPVNEIPARIIEYANVRPRVKVPSDSEEVEPDAREALQKIFAQLRVQTGHDFSQYKRSTMMRRIRRRMQICHLEELSGYLNVLRTVRGELDLRFNDLLITVTNFFRDPKAFEVLEQEILPKILAGKGQGDVGINTGSNTGSNTVRVWVAGCATGEEAYSIAMLLLEQVTQMEQMPEIQIFATDISERALLHARDGLYPDVIAADVSPERLERFFIAEHGGYRVREELREVVLFAPHNLVKDPPFSKLDLITCRNLLIYLRRDVQRQIFELFHYALRPSGYLFLGPSEAVDSAELFRHVNKKAGMFQRQHTSSEPRLPVLPLNPPRVVPLPARSNGSSDERRAEISSYGVLHGRVVERYAPPSVLVNEEYNVVHLSEQAGRYLYQGGGEPTNNVLKRVRPELRIELTAALYGAFEKGRALRTRPVTMQIEGEARQISLSVRPATDPDLQGFVLVIFDETAADEHERSVEGARQNDPTVRELEEELSYTKQRLRTTIEEFETSKEEMRATNEELQSMNEELKSTAEELETGREELQSMNEELVTVNQENKNKVEELSHLTDDLRNLLSASDIAILFLDRELRIQRFTPRLGELFNILHSDRGRPLGDITHKLGDGNLLQEARHVLKTLVPIEREIRSEDGRWYLQRMLPYRTLEDRIEGVVMTFVEITIIKAAQLALRQGEERYRALIESSAQIVWTTDAEGNVVEDSPPWRAFTGQTFEQWKGWGWVDAVHPDDRECITQNWRTCVESETPLDTEFRLWHAASETWHWMRVRAVPLYKEVDGAKGDGRGWVGMNMDIQQRKEAEAALRDSEERYRLMVENINEYAIFTTDNAGNIATWNPGAEQTLGWLEEDIVGQHISIIFTPEDREHGAVQTELETAKKDGQAKDERWHRRQDGSTFWANGILSALHDDEGNLLGFVKLLRDETERRRAEEALRESEARLRQALDAAEMGIWQHEIAEGLSHFDQRARDIFGFDKRTLTQDEVMQAIYPDDSEEFLRAQNQALDPTQPVSFQKTHRIVWPDGSLRWVEGHAHVLFAGEGEARRPVQAVGVIMDVTKRQEAEESLRQLNETLEERVDERTAQVRELASELVLAEQNERHRIAQMLHDELQQQLYAIQMHLKVLGSDLAESHSTAYAEQTQALVEYLGDAITITRRLTLDLSPPVLQGEGLVEALRWLVAHMNETYGLHVELVVKKRPPSVDDGLRVLLFQLVRELLFNVVKHAGVKQARVEVRALDHHVEIQVIDEGEGFDVQAIFTERPAGGWGLYSVRERLNLFDGHLNVESEPGVGTCITIVAPVQRG